MRYFRSMIKEFFDMSYITITTEKNETYSSISNFFIDYYMTSASGEFVKVYLYLVRLMSSSKPVSVANIADHFNLTEKDICRAIKYWISQDVMKLNYNKKKELTGITLLPLHDKGISSDSGVDDLSILGMDYSTGDDDNNSEITATITDEDKAEVPERTLPDKITVTPEFLRKKQEDEVLSDIMFETEAYFGRPLSMPESESLIYI